MKYIFEYIVFDERYHWLKMDADGIFATNEFDEAKLVANEVGFYSVVIRVDIKTGNHTLVYDARYNEELALRE